MADNQLNKANNSGGYPPKKKFWRLAFGMVGLIILAFLATVAWQFYVNYERGEWEMRLIQAMDEAHKAKLKMEAADTYGGKTPQETLQMYIDAVEKGNYELASKYFVLEKQAKESESFKGANKDKISSYLSIVRKSATDNGSYSASGNYYSFNGSLLISLEKYPSGVWKIIEI